MSLQTPAPVPVPLGVEPPGALARIVRADNDLLFDATGRSWIDMFSANGAALLGHVHPEITSALQAQLQSVWLTGGLPTDAGDEAQAALESWLPTGLGLGGLYSTGMEASEFAQRIARVHTGRTDFIGFDNSMHGKSALTAALGWANAPASPRVHRLRAWPERQTRAVLEDVETCLRQHSVAAVFLEPVLGSGGGHVAPADLCEGLLTLCRQHGSLLVVDEILTGLHRTGPPLAFPPEPLVPDLLLLGKALGNGFPVSAVARRRDIGITPPMLAGSTYAGNPLAARAVTATLAVLRQTDVAAQVASIHECMSATAASLPGAVLRGRGALWMLELPSTAMAQALLRSLYERGIFVSSTGPYLRLMPAVTLRPAHLARACQALVEAYQELLA